jgi:hypothetical protein
MGRRKFASGVMDGKKLIRKRNFCANFQGVFNLIFSDEKQTCFGASNE